MAGKKGEKENSSLKSLETLPAKKPAHQRQTRSHKEDMSDANEHDTVASLASGSAATLAPNSATISMDILAEIRDLAKKVNTMDETMGNRLDSIDGSLTEIKTSVTSVENSIIFLSERATNLEARVDEAESRISASEDLANEHDSKLKSLEKSVALFKQKVDNLEDAQRRRNLKIVNFPDNVEKDLPLAPFLQLLLPKLLELPSDYPPLDIEFARRRDGPNSGSTAKTVLVRFLRTSQRDAVIKAAAGKRSIEYESSTLRFYPDVPTDVLRRRREYEPVKKAMKSHNMYRGFVYPDRLRCLHEGRIRLFDTPASAAEFLRSIKIDLPSE